MGIGQRFAREKITQLRESLGMSPEVFARTIQQIHLAKRATMDDPMASKISRLSGVSVRRWESGENSPGVYVIEAITQAFGVSVSYFFVDCD